MTSTTSGWISYTLRELWCHDSVDALIDRCYLRPIEEQIASGESVDPANLEPSDLVFFQNTYKPGLSHVGIYIGEGQFVNAGSEDDVVAISNMWDDYWGPRYLESRRIGCTIA